MARKHDYSRKELEIIWEEVPADYYQKGTQKNILQKMWHTGKLNNVINLMNKNPKNILDLGCAGGWFLSNISRAFPQAKCTGIDPYIKAIKYANKEYPGIKFVAADGHKIPFPDKSFDTVLCTEVLEHVASPEKVLKEIKRVLKNNGTSIIEMDSGNWLFNIIWHWWTNMRKGVWRDAHIHKFNAKKLRKMILDQGFKITGEKNFNFTMAVIFRAEHK